MRTSELAGAALDWAVAKCSFVEGTARSLIAADVKPYSTSWQEGGPIIERERITLVSMPDGTWQSQGRNQRPHFHNPTPLIAAMRCFVASRLGDTVDIPEELLD